MKKNDGSIRFSIDYQELNKCISILFVKKNDGSIRLSIDHQELNKIIVQNRYLLPKIDDLFDQLQSSQKLISILTNTN